MKGIKGMKQILKRFVFILIPFIPFIPVNDFDG
jgi:hypothetical protein